MNNFFLLLSFFIAVSSAKWEDVGQLCKDTSNCFSLNSYIDKATDIMHVLLFKDSFYGVQRIFPDKTFSEFIPIMKCINFGVDIGKITGSDDGKHIYAVFSSGRYNEANNFCSSSGTAGCHEVYFSESSSNGLTWSPSVKIERNDMRDMTLRDSISLIHIKKTNRLFIFFEYDNVKDRIGAVGFTTRPSESSYFTPEKLIFSAYKSKIYAVHAGYSYDKIQGTTLLHVSWSQTDVEKYDYPHQIYYASSNNDGISWSAPLNLGIKYAKFNYFTQFQATPELRIIYLTYQTPDYNTCLKASYDDGKTWKSLIIFPQEKNLASTICGNLMLTLSYSYQEKELRLITYNGLTKTLKFEESLNITLMLGMSLDCTHENYGIFLVNAVINYMDERTRDYVKAFSIPISDSANNQ